MHLHFEIKIIELILESNYSIKNITFNCLLCSKYNEHRNEAISFHGFQMVGKAQKSGEDEKEEGVSPPSSPQFPPLFVFALSQFPRVYSLHPPHFRSNWLAFPKYSSSFDFEQ